MISVGRILAATAGHVFLNAKRNSPVVTTGLQRVEAIGRGERI
jgi:hypothetical protein